ncbi:MAG: hypothetical protein E7600_02885 [Ruminococcaceae bacterium]|nr:hypothetical protein [Oscillospiraceae bacterium]
MSKNDYGSDSLFLQRLEDMVCVCTEKYVPQFTHFLDGKSLKIALEYLSRCSDIVVLCNGGFVNAERCVIGIYPKDIYGYVDCATDEMTELMNIKGLVIEGSGFSSFSHRDCMGAVLALGIKREVLGDIYLPKDSSLAYICLTEVAANYLCENIEFIGKDKVKTRIIDVSLLPEIVREFVVISGTVASDRLDSIVSLATKLSREKAKQLVSSGMIKVNHFEEIRADFQVDEGDVLSIRGFGRYVVSELPGITKKGRNKVIIHKMI